MLKRFFYISLCLWSLSWEGIQAKDSVALWQQYVAAAGTDKKLELIGDINRYYARQPYVRDSLFTLAIESSSLAGTDSLTIPLLVNYFENKVYKEEEIANLQEVEEKAKQLNELATAHNDNVWRYSGYKALAVVAGAAKNYRVASSWMEKAYKIASLTRQPRLMADALLYLGLCTERQNRKVDAFFQYTEALVMAEELDDRQLKYQGYGRLADFYHSLNNLQKARDYKTRQIGLVTSEHPVDSFDYFGLLKDYMLILFDNHDEHEARRIFQKIVNYANAHQYPSLKDNVFSIYRYYLIKGNQLTALSQLYEEDYPEELARLRAKNDFNYLRLQAYFSEVHGHFDSAFLYYQMATAALARERPHDVDNRTNLHKRFGEFLFRSGKLQPALQQFDSAMTSAELSSYLPFKADVAHYLDTVHYLLGHYKEAYQYAQLEKKYSDSATALNKAEAILKNEVEFEEKQKEIALAADEEKTRRRHNLQYMGLAIGVFSSFIILAMLGSFKVHRWFIKAMGFFAFIFFFEFIILLADNQIHHITHGEPWKVMAIKIVLIGILLPLHHWLEEQVVHYLQHHKLIDPRKISLRWKRKKPQVESTADIGSN